MRINAVEDNVVFYRMNNGKKELVKEADTKVGNLKAPSLEKGWIFSENGYSTSQHRLQYLQVRSLFFPLAPPLRRTVTKTVGLKTVQKDKKRRS